MFTSFLSCDFILSICTLFWRLSSYKTSIIRGVLLLWIDMTHLTWNLFIKDWYFLNILLIWQGREAKYIIWRKKCVILYKRKYSPIHTTGCLYILGIPSSILMFVLLLCQNLILTRGWDKKIVTFHTTHSIHNIIYWLRR